MKKAIFLKISPLSSPSTYFISLLIGNLLKFVFIYFIFGCTESSLAPQGFLQLRQVVAGYSLVAVHELLVAVASLAAEPGL